MQRDVICFVFRGYGDTIFYSPITTNNQTGKWIRTICSMTGRIKPEAATSDKKPSQNFFCEIGNLPFGNRPDVHMA